MRPAMLAYWGFGMAPMPLSWGHNAAEAAPHGGAGAGAQAGA
ncbi:hypothetical protein [Acetobacter pasteurianus]